MTRCLFFRLIKDDKVNLADRIILGFLFKRAAINFKAIKNPAKYKARPYSDNYLRKATGFGAPTIRKSIAKLKSLGYLDGRMEPYTKHANYMRSKDGKTLLYRTLKWEQGNKHDIKRHVALEFIRGTIERSKNAGPSYFSKALGINRDTAAIYIARVTAETVQEGCNGSDRGCNGSDIKVVTVPTSGVVTVPTSGCNGSDTSITTRNTNYPSNTIEVSQYRNPAAYVGSEVCLIKYEDAAAPADSADSADTGTVIPAAFADSDEIADAVAAIILAA